MSASSIITIFHNNHNNLCHYSCVCKQLRVALNNKQEDIAAHSKSKMPFRHSLIKVPFSSHDAKLFRDVAKT